MASSRGFLNIQSLNELTYEKHLSTSVQPKKLRTTTQTLLLLAPFGFYSTAYCSHTFAHRQRAAEHQKPTSITHNPLYEYTVRQGLNGERRVELDLEATPRRT
jgi:hypothetical protein